MAEVLASLKKIGGSGEQYTETVLWTNPSPTASYAGGVNVTLSDSIGNYKYLMVRYRVSTSNATEFETIVSTSDFRKSLAAQNAPQWSFQARVSTGYYDNRFVVYVDDTTVLIRPAYHINASGTDNTAAIPLEILGINELAHKTTIAMDLIGEVSLPANTSTVTCTTTQNISDYKNLFITAAEYNGSALVTTSVATPPLQFVDTEYFASNSVTGYYAAGSTLTSYAITMQKLSDTSIKFTRPTASGTRQVYVYGIK